MERSGGAVEIEQLRGRQHLRTIACWKTAATSIYGGSGSSSMRSLRRGFSSTRGASTYSLSSSRVSIFAPFLSIGFYSKAGRVYTLMTSPSLYFGNKGTMEGGGGGGRKRGFFGRGGSPENLGYPCEPISKVKVAGALFRFSKGCLSMARWDELNFLFQKTGAIITFGLNALRGRHHVRNVVWEGAWDSCNARDFIKYTISKGYPVVSWEFGNELSGRGIGASVGAEQYGKDVIILRNILSELYKNSTLRPLLLAPGGFYEQQWYAKLLQVSGFGAVDGMTHHVYNLGGGNDPNIIKKITNPEYLNHIANTFRDLELTIKRHGPWSSAWVGEAGGAYNSGSPFISNTFLNSIWIDELRVFTEEELVEKALEDDDFHARCSNSSRFAGSPLVGLCLRGENIGDARKTFEEIMQEEVVAYTSMASTQLHPQQF